MNCAEYRDLLAEYHLGNLPAETAREVRAHCAACAECRRELQETAEAFALLAVAEPGAPPAPSLKASLLARIQVDRADALPRPVPRRGLRRATWSVALAAGLAAVFAGFATARWTRSLKEQSAPGIATRPQLIAPPVRFAALLAPAGQKGATGYVVWDSLAGELQFFAEQLASPAPGNIYRAWFVRDDGTWAQAGELHPSASGACQAKFPLPQDSGSLRRIVVTESPANVDGPHGTLRMSAELARPGE
jgi:anti-sigma-K factor RskA